MVLPWKKSAYLDYAAATPMHWRVWLAMQKYWSRSFHNPSAIYAEGVKVRRDVEHSRTQVARMVGVAKTGVIFTSGGTESNNLAILGTLASCQIAKPHIIISSREHPAVKEAALEIKRRGGKVSVIKADESGFVSPQEVLAQVKSNTFLVSVMLADNEVGSVQPVVKIGRLIREYRKKKGTEYPYLHTDASQAPNYLPTNIESLNVDLLTLDGAKIYGPKGVGVLAVRTGINLKPIIFGGGQERGLRSGTENPAFIVGFAKALSLAVKDRDKEFSRLSLLKEYFIREVRRDLPQVIINNPEEDTLPNIVSVSLPDTPSELIVLKFDKFGVAISTGSSCRANADVEDLDALRFSFGRQTKKKDVDYALQVFRQIVKRDNI